MYKNKNEIGIDWISFTSFEPLSVVLDHLGLHDRDLYNLDTGRNGYNTVYKIKDFNAYIMCHTSRKDMGVHVDISASGIDGMFKMWCDKHVEELDVPFQGMEARFSILDYLTSIRKYLGHFTRVDIAYDDFEYNGVLPAYTPRQLFKLQEAGRIVSKYRNFKLIDEKKSNEYTGATFYAGSRSSGNILRVYDKKLEQNKKLKALGKDLLHGEWIRWELELHDERANLFVDLLVEEWSDAYSGSCNNVLTLYFQKVLMGLMRIIKLDDSNKSRCSTCNKWLKFLNNVEKASISIQVYESTLSKKLGWVKRAVFPTITALFVGHGYNLNFLLGQCVDSYKKLSERMRISLKELDENVYDTLQMIDDSVVPPKPLFKEE